MNGITAATSAATAAAVMMMMMMMLASSCTVVAATAEDLCLNRGEINVNHGEVKMIGTIYELSPYNFSSFILYTRQDLGFNGLIAQVTDGYGLHFDPVCFGNDGLWRMITVSGFYKWKVFGIRVKTNFCDMLCGFPLLFEKYGNIKIKAHGPSEWRADRNVLSEKCIGADGLSPPRDTSVCSIIDRGKVLNSRVRRDDSESEVLSVNEKEIDDNCRSEMDNGFYLMSILSGLLAVLFLLLCGLVICSICCK